MSQLRVLSAVIACASAAVIGVSTLTPAFAADMNTPDYAEVEASFVREQTDADFRSQYHYAPVFQPVENQCANVMQGNWARVNCWTDDGDNMIVRVEVLHRNGAVGVYVKDDTATSSDGGEVRTFDGRAKRYFPIPAENRTADGKPYVIFSMNYWESEAFYLEFVTSENSRWPAYTVTVTQNVNRGSDADPVVARQAVVYDKTFYKLSQALSFDRYEVVDGRLKAVYSMVHATESEADLIDRIELWPVNAQTYTWRPEASDGNWARYVATRNRPIGCYPANDDVPRVSAIAAAEAPGLDIRTYTLDSAEYPLIRDGAKTSIYVDVTDGQSRFQYETWMSGCTNSFGRPGQQRPYQGQVVAPEASRMEVHKELGPVAANLVANSQEFGGQVTYPAGTYTKTYANTSGWQGLDWTGQRSWTYPENTLDWSATAGGVWNSPILPAHASVTITENAPSQAHVGTWMTNLPTGSHVLPAMLPSGDLSVFGSSRAAVNVANTVPTTMVCLTGDTQPVTPEGVWQDESTYLRALVGNELTYPLCVEIPAQPQIIDQCGPDNAVYSLPENTPTVSWTRHEDGSVTAQIAQGYVFTDGSTELTFPAPTDSGVPCEDPKEPEDPKTPEDPKPQPPAKGDTPPTTPGKTTPKTLPNTGSTAAILGGTSALVVAMGALLLATRRRMSR